MIKRYKQKINELHTVKERKDEERIENKRLGMRTLPKTAAYKKEKARQKEIRASLSERELIAEKTI